MIVISDVNRILQKLNMLRDDVHWVNGSKHSLGYYRRKPYTYKLPTPAQQEIRAQFAQLMSEKGGGVTGSTEIDGKGMPNTAKIIKEDFTGTRSEKHKVKGKIRPYREIVMYFDETIKDWVVGVV